MKPARTGRSLLLVLGLAAPVGPLEAQSMMERSPNVTGGWVGQNGSFYFNFLHRFVASPEPARKVSNFPTFTVALGLPANTLLGANYATNSLLAPGYPNEWEIFARNRPFSVAKGAPLDLGLQIGYNLAADGVDGEVAVSRAIGPVRPTVALRVLSDPYEAGSTQLAAAGGAVVRVHRFVSLAGDVGRLFDCEAPACPTGDRLAWSAGVHLALPYTPHTLSLHASNTNNTTLQGASRGERTRWGFEFTIPLTLARWLAPAPEPAPPLVTESEPARVDTVVVVDTITVVDTVVIREAAADPAQVAPRDTTPAAVAPAPAQPPRPRPAPPAATVRSADIRGLAFAPARIEVTRGTVIEWTNRDQVQHSVTARDGSFDSGLIDPGARYRRTFDRAGTFQIVCRPHPFMSLTVVVR